ncbi:KRAB-A domain-containing protein 2 [Eumeta japonica]|uniref:KRAB-A domain-containing protein 2 n=1 Tax=Eumeta variegata TaxID=151549 RepID=A0A4C1U457_EUMVA|nr:KRAB-A domain-containing protein 2 [Eumeta japonica]
MQEVNGFTDTFDTELSKFYQTRTGAVKTPWAKEKIFEVIRHVKSAEVAINSGVRRNAAEYYWSSRYDVMNIGGSDYLILKRKNHDSPTVRVVPLEEYYDILTDIHKSCGHGGRDKIQYKLKDKFVIHLMVNLNGCSTIKTMLLNLFILDHFLQNKRVKLHSNYLKSFLEFGAPYILQSDNGREFTAKIIAEMVNMWPDCKIIHGTPRHPQTQGSVERSNQDVENMLRAWMRDNNSTNWAIGCSFVQYNKNNSFHRILGRSPFPALFGCEPKSGLQCFNVPSGNFNHIHSEEQLQQICDMEQAVTENVLEMPSEHQTRSKQLKSKYLKFLSYSK